MLSNFLSAFNEIKLLIRVLNKSSALFSKKDCHCEKDNFGYNNSMYLGKIL